MVPTCWFLILVWAWCLPLVPAAEEQREACLPQRCGNVTVSRPFGDEVNGCAQLGFQMHCTGDVPYLGFYEPGFELQILDIFYDNSSLLVSDVHKLADFSNRSKGGCHVPVADTATKVGHPFSIRPLNRNLVFYKCTRDPGVVERERAGLVETACRNHTFVRAGGQYDESGGVNGGYVMEGCSSLAVPVLAAEYGDANASDYLELISDGFLLTWHQPPPPGSSGK